MGQEIIEYTSKVNDYKIEQQNIYKNLCRACINNFSPDRCPLQATSAEDTAELLCDQM